MKILIVLAILSSVSAVVPVDRPAAQGRGSRDDGAGARTDAILGTPNRTIPVPQTNMFSTSPGLEQQAPMPVSPAAPKRSQDTSADKVQHPTRP
jgi:hypothetical protein